MEVENLEGPDSDTATYQPAQRTDTQETRHGDRTVRCLPRAVLQAVTHGLKGSSQTPPAPPHLTSPSLRISCCFLGLTCFRNGAVRRELWLGFSRNSEGV